MLNLLTALLIIALLCCIVMWVAAQYPLRRPPRATLPKAKAPLEPQGEPLPGHRTSGDGDGDFIFDVSLDDEASITHADKRRGL